jgi:gamma-glutamylcyclotransferase (GGCT)/AIG2-like uncharacterized protein YtfP
MWSFKKRLSFVPESAISDEQRNLIHSYCRENPSTPDILKLQKKKRVLLFVYDQMLSKGREHDLVSETSITGKWPIYSGYTESKFHLWNKNLGKESYPVALKEDVTGFYKGEKQPAAKIWGELYAIRPSQFILLDSVRDNGVQFIREEVEICVPMDKVLYSKQQPVPHIPENDMLWRFPAQMYVGIYKYWDDQLAGLFPSDPFQPQFSTRKWLGNFYRYRPKG